MIKAVVFDCFGVLITDALEGIVAGFRDTEPEKAQHIWDAVAAANKGLISSDDSRRIVAQELGLSTDEYVNQLRNSEVKNQPLLDYIQRLRKRYKIALLSNTGTRGLEVRFTPGELADHFDVVVASGVIGYAKPEAQAYEITATRLGVRLSECVMIDDREEYCLGAQGVGMQAIQYLSFDQAIQDLKHLLGE